MQEGDGKIAEVARLFLKLGVIAFGGPAAHIAMMQEEVVKKRKWMDDEHFLDLLGATNLIPGPNSTEMAIHIGRERGGWKGLIVAGVCFIFPAVIITGFLAWLYKNYGQLPDVQSYIYGIKPAIIAIIISAVYPLGKKALKSIELGLIGIIALIACFIGVNEIVVMFGSGLFAVFLTLIRSGKLDSNKSFLFPLSLISLSGPTLLPVSNLTIFLIFLKVGSVLYGSGYVLFGLLDNELVMKGILSRQQLIDAIAVGQFTPGPVFSSVTFIGWQINNFWGAVAATTGVFLPSFLFVGLLNPLIPAIRKSKLFSAFLDAVNIASIAVIVMVVYLMGKDTISDWRTIVIAILSLIVTFVFKKVNTVFIVIGGSVAGYLLTLI